MTGVFSIEMTFDVKSDSQKGVSHGKNLERGILQKNNMDCKNSELIKNCDFQKQERK